MRYYLDCEFNGYRGALISLALVREDGRELYLVEREAWERRILDFDPWVRDNVLPILRSEGAAPSEQHASVFGHEIGQFLMGDECPIICADWPDDIRYFCEAIIIGPGKMIEVPGITFEVFRVDAYPTDLPGAVQHNALWDARALRRKLTGQATAPAVSGI